MKTYQIKFKPADSMDKDRFFLFNLSDDTRMTPRRVVYREWLATNPNCPFRAYADSGSDEFGERGYSDLSGPEWLRRCGARVIANTGGYDCPRCYRHYSVKGKLIGNNQLIQFHENAEKKDIKTMQYEDDKLEVDNETAH